MPGTHSGYGRLIGCSFLLLLFNVLYKFSHHHHGSFILSIWGYSSSLLLFFSFLCFLLGGSLIINLCGVCFWCSDQGGNHRHEGVEED